MIYQRSLPGGHTRLDELLSRYGSIGIRRTRLIISDALFGPTAWFGFMAFLVNFSSSKDALKNIKYNANLITSIWMEYNILLGIPIG